MDNTETEATQVAPELLGHLLHLLAFRFCRTSDTQDCCPGVLTVGW